jgi:zinc transport system substrate-binding protein
MTVRPLTRRDLGWLAAAAAVAGLATPVLAQDRPVIATDSYPLAYFAGRLVGDQAEILFAVPPQVDPSFWRPGIADITAIQSAALIALNGAGFAAWTTQTTLPRSRTVDTSAGFAEAFIQTETITHSHGADGEHSHTGTASYLWLDLALATRQAEALAAALRRVLPDGEEQIDANLAALAVDLAALDTTARQVGARAGGVPMIASHPRYQYLARAYGLDLTSVEWDAATPPSEDQWQDLAQQIARTGARVFLWEADPGPEARGRMDSLGLVSVVFPPLANRPEEGDFLTVLTLALADLDKALAEVAG